jgi:hypothetical protein
MRPARGSGGWLASLLFSQILDNVSRMMNSFSVLIIVEEFYKAKKRGF